MVRYDRGQSLTGIFVLLAVFFLMFLIAIMISAGAVDEFIETWIPFVGYAALSILAI